MNLPLELKNDIFKYFSIKKFISLINISSAIYLLNKNYLKQIWEKNKPLKLNEWTNLLTKMRKYCNKDLKILNDVIKLIEINEKIYGIRLYNDYKTLFVFNINNYLFIFLDE
ncbi:hypothetical protein Mgra_00009601 [Meloidogyne graminicola]|uniref:F-box domain-containing protein n=1 Tax=Meloidogyne graminicola TaxID=189291 RepID=A0A8S9ZB41_9BILA|nr:hypothetical protein Mgra_00009601 [Meloidogyne graminicola]